MRTLAGAPCAWAALLLGTLAVLALPPGAAAQGVLGVDPLGRSGEPPPLPQELPRRFPPPPVLPPLPPPPPEERLAVPGEQIHVKKIRLVGATVLSPEELAKVTAPYENRLLTAEDLENLRLALTVLYVNAGYVNSGAVIPDQTVEDGVVTLQIIEGQLTGIEIAGNRWFRQKYLRDRLRLGAGAPLNANALQDEMQRLLEDQRIRRLNAELRPGLGLGESVLAVEVEDRQPFRLTLGFDNYQSPSVGAERGWVTVEDANLLGLGDVLTLHYGRSESPRPQFDLRYVLPVTARDTTLSFQYRRNDFDNISPVFAELDIVSTSDAYTLAVRHPVYRTLNHELALELGLERLSNSTTLLDEPFSLTPGAQRGVSTVAALRALQEYVYRSEHRVVAVRSRFSFGLDAFGSTINDDSALPDSRFFAWLGQAQWVERLPWLDAQLIARADLQLASDRLLSLEQIAVGGRYTVRGYPENTRISDNAFIASLEGRLPLIRGRPWADTLELAPFVDFGRPWNVRGRSGPHDNLGSLGLGLRWGLTLPLGPVALRSQFELYWGYPLRTVPSTGNTLQDEGLHLQFVLGLF
jgi:hemolysin activation/secretion protein